MEDYLLYKRDQNRKRVSKHYYKKKSKKARTTSAIDDDGLRNGEANINENEHNADVANEDFLFGSCDDKLTCADDHPLYPNSDIHYGEFLKLFVTILDKLHSPDSVKDQLVKLIKATLPRENRVPKSYYMLKNELRLKKLNLAKRQYVCLSCNKKIVKDALCLEPGCIHFRSQKINQNRTSPYYITNDYLTHFKSIISKNWDVIVEYKSEMNNNTLITDLCNANVYKNSNDITTNSIAIILFVDEAEMTETSKDNNVYVILGLIMNLPLRMRSSYFNIINFMFWGGYIVNFNNLFNFFEPNLDTFFNRDIRINGNLTVKFKIFTKHLIKYKIKS
jgi:hypothetical protein